MNLKSQLMDETQMNRSMARIAHEIIEKNEHIQDVCLLGIKRRGIPLSRLIQADILKFEGICLPCGSIDISLYRDDLSQISEDARTKACDIPFSITQKNIILIDDVLYTGRTVRAAIEAIFSHGRPQSIQLAVLVDRGHRELPIRPDYVGKNIPTSRHELVAVKVKEYDDINGVDLYTL